MKVSKKGVRQFPPVSSNMLDEGGAGGKKKGMSGGIYLRCKGPSQLLTEHRPEWEAGILRWGTLILRGRDGERLSTELGLEYGQLLDRDMDIAMVLDAKIWS